MELANAERAVGKVVILVTMAVQSFLVESDDGIVDALLDSDRLDKNLQALKRLAKTRRLAELDQNCLPESWLPCDARSDSPGSGTLSSIQWSRSATRAWAR